MRITGRVSLEELDTYAHSMGFDNWRTYRSTLSEIDINLVFNTIYESQKESS